MGSRNSEGFVVTVELLRRAGLSDAQIISILELALIERHTDRAEHNVKKREQARIRSRRYRQRLKTRGERS